MQTTTLPLATTPGCFVLYDDRLNVFKDVEDLSNGIEALAEIVDNLLADFPFAAYMPAWAPDSLMFGSASPFSPLRILYQVLEEQLSICGFTIQVISKLTVLKHEPRLPTVISTNTTFRFHSLH